MKRKIGYIFLTVISFMIFTACKGQVGKTIILKNEAELIKEKQSKRYKLKIDNERIKVVDGTADLNNLEYDKDITLGIKEDSIYKLVSLKVNGEEKKDEIVDGKLKLTIKEDTQVVSSYIEKEHIIKIEKESVKYVKFISSASLKKGDYCIFELHNLSDLYKYSVSVTNVLDKDLKLEDGKYKFKTTGDNTIKVLKEDNFRKLNIFYSMQKSQLGQYNLIEALLKGIFFRPSDILFIGNNIVLKEANTKYSQDENGKLVSWNIDVLEVANRVYKFKFDYEKIFSEEELGKRVKLIEKENRLVFRLYKELPSVNDSLYEDYIVKFKLNYKNSNGELKEDNLEIKQGEISMDIQNKKDVSLRIDVEIL